MSCRRYHILYYLRHTTWTKIPCPWVRSANETYPKTPQIRNWIPSQWSITMKLIYLLVPYLQHPWFIQPPLRKCTFLWCIPFSPSWYNGSCQVAAERTTVFSCIGGVQNSLTPKGLLITVATTHASIISNDHVDNGDSAQCMVFYQLPAGCNAVLINWENTILCSGEPRGGFDRWVNNSRRILQDTITQHMGHLKNIPYLPEWKSFLSSAKSLKDKNKD